MSLRPIPIFVDIQNFGYVHRAWIQPLQSEGYVTANPRDCRPIALCEGKASRNDLRMYHRRVAEFRNRMKLKRLKSARRLVQRAIESPIGRSSDSGTDRQKLFANLVCRTVTVYLTR